MLYFLFSYLSYLLQNLSNKEFNRALKNGGTGALLAQNGGSALVAAILFFTISDFELLSFKILLLSIAFGVFYLLTVFFLLKAFYLGAIGGSTLLCNTGMFLAAIYGVLIFKDAFTVFIAVSVAFMFVSVVLLTSKKEGENGFNIQWLICGLLSGLFNSFVALVKRAATAFYPDNTQNFLSWGFLFAALTALVMIIFNRNSRKDCIKVFKKPKLIICNVLTGFGNAGGNCFQMMALKTVSSAIIFPLNSCAISVTLWIVSFLFYKENKINIKNILAIVFCVAAIIIMNIQV